jgi:hypothetical protein
MSTVNTRDAFSDDLDELTAVFHRVLQRTALARWLDLRSGARTA